MKIVVVLHCFIIVFGNITQSTINEDIGPVSLHARLGNVANKYEPLSPTDVTASRNAAKAVEELRVVFPIGSGSVPALDPYQRARIEPIDFGTSGSLLSGKVNLRNLVIFGAQNFTLNDVQVRLRNYRMDFTLSFPLLYGEADFEAEVYFGFLPFSFAGRASVTAYDVTISGAVSAVQAQHRAQEIFKLTAAEANVTSRNVRVTISDPRLKEAITTLNGDASLSSLFKVVKPYISEAGAKIALEQANQILQEFKAEEVLNHLVPK